MSLLRNNQKNDDSNNFKNLDKSILLQETRYFNDIPVNNQKCILTLTKNLFLLNQGDQQLTKQEATVLFFAITKLFPSEDVMLRHLLYLCIKELSSPAQDVIIVTSSLTKDMVGKELYRAAAIRAFYSISDSTMLQAMERYMKQAILDKNSAVSSAALVSALHLSKTVPELVRRWGNEAQEAIMSENTMVSYHALAVVAEIRRNERLSIVRLVIKLAEVRLHSPYALCLLIRHAAKLAQEDGNDTSEPYIEFIKSCLRHKSEMVVYEAAFAIINFPDSRILAEAVSVLQIFCGSPKSTVRLAGVRTLLKLSANHPKTVAAFDLETLISDPHMYVATTAVTTLLATASEISLEGLMKPRSNFMAQISEDLKIDVVSHIRKLCSKFPTKHQFLAAFLAGMWRDEGGLEYKTAIVGAIIALLEENSEAKETCLTHLCEFIEDCEHPTLTVLILDILGREGTQASQPSRCVRYIYNRLMLGSDSERAAAVSAAARLAGSLSDVLYSAREVLDRCLTDHEDEVRDRALYYTAIIDTASRHLVDDYILNVPRHDAAMLEMKLRGHLALNVDLPFDIDSLPIVQG